MYVISGYYSMPVSPDDYAKLFVTYSIKMNSPSATFSVTKHVCDTSWSGFDFGNRTTRAITRAFSYTGTNGNWMLTGDSSLW